MFFSLDLDFSMDYCCRMSRAWFSRFSLPPCHTPHSSLPTSSELFNTWPTAPDRSSPLTDLWSATLQMHSSVVASRCKRTLVQVSGALSLCISHLSSTLPLKFQPLQPDSPSLISPQLSEMVVLCSGSLSLIHTCEVPPGAKPGTW